MVHFRQIIRQLIAVGHVERTPYRSGFRVISRARMYRLSGDVVAFKSVFFLRHNWFLLMRYS